MNNVQNISLAYRVQQAALLHLIEVYTTGIHCLLSSGHMRLTESKPAFFLSETMTALLLKHARFTHFPLFNTHFDLVYQNYLRDLQIILPLSEVRIQMAIFLCICAFDHQESKRWTGKRQYNLKNIRNISLMKRQLVVTHTVRETEISAFIDSWVTNTPSVKMLCRHKKNCLTLHLRKNINC